MAGNATLGVNRQPFIEPIPEKEQLEHLGVLSVGIQQVRHLARFLTLV